jgi:protoheme ferro-lyase
VVDWLVLVFAGLVLGAGVVALMVLPRAGVWTSLAAIVVATAAAATAAAAIVTRFDTLEATALVGLSVVGCMAAGYRLAASLIPALAKYARPAVEEAQPVEAHETLVIVLACAEPERYEPGALAARNELLQDAGMPEIRPTALPWLFLSEKARYRTAGGRSPGPAAARMLAERIAESRKRHDSNPLAIAWCHPVDHLARLVETAAETGTTRVGVVTIGSPGAVGTDAARAAVEPVLRTHGAVSLAWARSLWSDRHLAEALAGRILDTARSGDADASVARSGSVGFVLLGEGLPTPWAQRHPQAAVDRNYFSQRVRMALADAGVPAYAMREAWLEWQSPDLIETVRHHAALGCRRIVVAPVGIALPSLQTALDIGPAIRFARVGDDVEVITIDPEDCTDLLAEAAARLAAEALA